VRIEKIHYNVELTRDSDLHLGRELDRRTTMIRVTSLYQACTELFTRYPLAARAVDRDGAVRLMVLMLRDCDDVSFFWLSRQRRDSGSLSYSLVPWPGGYVVDIEANDARVPDVATNAVLRGIPLPRHGSLFGWLGKDNIPVVVGCDTDSELAEQNPHWSVMARVGSPQSQWPPFTGEQFFGSWFWEYYRAGNLVSLDSLVFQTPGTVFWVHTQAIIGSDCFAVARDIEGPSGHTLQRGRYVDIGVLQAAIAVPPLSTLLADRPKVDLAPRFEQYAKDEAHANHLRSLGLLIWAVGGVGIFIPQANGRIMIKEPGKCAIHQPLLTGVPRPRQTQRIIERETVKIN
jgi:hypothetical protein